MNEQPMRTLPASGRASPRFGHLGVWNLSLGPNSPVPGERLQILILDHEGKVVRRFEQIEGRCIDPGYVDFFMSNRWPRLPDTMPQVNAARVSRRASGFES